jgi:hypothetical protein
MRFEVEGFYYDLPNGCFDGNGSYARKQLVFPLLLAGFSTGFSPERLAASRHLKRRGGSEPMSVSGLTSCRGTLWGHGIVVAGL